MPPNESKNDEMNRYALVRRVLFRAVASECVLIMGLAYLYVETLMIWPLILAAFTSAVFDYWLIRRMRKKLGPPGPKDVIPKSTVRNCYIGSGLFFLGFLHGVSMVFHGELEASLSPVLLIPLALSAYCLWIARKASKRRAVREEHR